VAANCYQPSHPSIRTNPTAQSHAVLACGADGCVRLFSSLQQQPLLRLYVSDGPLFGVEWSPTHPLVFATCAGNGSVLIYNLEQTQCSVPLPALTLHTQSGSSGGGGDGTVVGGGSRGAQQHRTVATFNRSGWLAAAAGCEIKVWRLPAALACSPDGSVQQMQAAKQLARMVAAA